MDQEFEEKGMRVRQITPRPTVTKIKDLIIQQRVAQQHHNNAAYFLEYNYSTRF